MPLRGRVVLASANPGKLRELALLLAPAGFEVVAQSEFGVAPVKESGTTFVENALLKARAASAAGGCAAVADDSGLRVDALGGAPGVRSARLAGEGASDADNIRALLSLMEDVEEERRGASFVCVVVCLRSPGDPLPVICQASWRGRILREPRGTRGFGYDPIFHPCGYRASVAELSPEAKNASSHRARALRKLLERVAPRQGGWQGDRDSGGCSGDSAAAGPPHRGRPGDELRSSGA